MTESKVLSREETQLDSNTCSPSPHCRRRQARPSRRKASDNMLSISRPLCRGASSLLQTPASRSLSTLAPRFSSAARSRIVGTSNNAAAAAASASVGGKRFEATLAGPAVPATPEFDPHAVTAMDKQTPPQPGADFNVVIVGA